MKVLITGVTGYLGRAILTLLKQEEGMEIRALCRRDPEPDDVLKDVEIVKGDLTDPSSLKPAVQGCDAVFHSAGLVSIWQKDPSIFTRINVTGTENLIDAAFHAGCSRFVYTSSFFALGPTKETPADEQWFNEDIPPLTDYARSKREAELMVRQKIEKGLDIVMVYPVLIYGPGKATQGNHITKMVEEFAKRRIPGSIGNGDKRWTFSYIDDVAKGHLLALQKGKKGEGYILGGQDAALLEFFEILHDITGIKKPKRKIPYSIAKAIAWVEECRAKWSRNYLPRITRDVVDVYQHHWRFSSQKAITELGYSRTPLKVGLWKTLESLGFPPPEERSTIL